MLLAPFGEKLVHPKPGMVVSLVSSKEGVFLVVDNRSVGALTLEPAAADRIAVIDIFGPVVEISCVNEDLPSKGKKKSKKPTVPDSSGARMRDLENRKTAEFFDHHHHRAPSVSPRYSADLCSLSDAGTLP